MMMFNDLLENMTSFKKLNIYLAIPTQRGTGHVRKELGVMNQATDLRESFAVKQGPSIRISLYANYWLCNVLLVQDGQRCL